ncbi:MAG: DUF2062 domain-containing protein [Desulfatiglandaceae bacterium]
MRLNRQVKYYYLRFIRLRGDPHGLALGMAFGVFTGMMPIMPFQMALAVALAILFKGSKVTAALGTWVSNPINWYFFYYFSYKLGAFVLGGGGCNRMFPAIMGAIRSGEDAMIVAEKIFTAGGMMMASFLIGGLMMGIVASIPAYFIFLFIFRRIQRWRESVKQGRH